MNTPALVGLGALALVLFSFTEKIAAAGNLVFYPKSLKDIHFEGITPVFVFGIAVQNTSAQSYTLNSMAGSLYEGNYLIGNVSNFTPQQIGPNRQSIVYFNVRMSILNIVSDLINKIQNKTYSAALELESHANIDGHQVPINLKFQFKVGG